MIPISLKLSNFTSYGQNPPELNFKRFKLAAISGLNGAGKSSLLDAITWCVWGTSRAGDSSDDLIHKGAENMQVEFSFEFDNHTYTIKRRRSRKGSGSTALELWSNSHNLTEGTIKATQEKIIQTLHLTFETFTNSSYLRQGHEDEFTTKGPTDRKRILSEILGLSHYDKLEEKAKEKIKDSQTKLQLLEYQLLEIEAELSQKDQSEEKKILAEKKISEAETQILTLENELKSLQQQNAILNATNEQQDKLRQTLTQLQQELDKILTQGKSRAEKIKQLEIALMELPTFEEKLKELRSKELEKEQYSLLLQKKLELENKLTSAKSSLDLKKLQRENLEKNLNDIKSHLIDLGGNSASCPTCGQIINRDQRQKVKQEYLTQEKVIKTKVVAIKTVDEENEILKLKKEIDNIQLDNRKYQDILNTITKLSALAEKREKLIAAQATLDSEKKVVQELRILFSNKKNQIDKLEKEVQALPNLREDLATLENQISRKELLLNNFRSEEKEARNLLGQATQLISRVQQLEKFEKLKKEEKLKLNHEQKIFGELALAFGKKGIQAMIIEAAIPEIEEETNQLLGRLTDGRMKVSLQTQRETKTKITGGEKGIVETLDIIISDEMGERPYEMYSVDGNELVYIRQNGQIKSIPIAQLWSEYEITETQGKYQLQNTNIEALCYVKGKAVWEKVDKILRHKSPKRILEVKCGPGNYTVRLTKNHSIYYMTTEGLRVKRTDQLMPGDYLLSPRIVEIQKTSEHIDLKYYITEEFAAKRKINNKSLNFDENFIWSRSDQKIRRFIPVDCGWGRLLGIAVAEGSGQIGYSIAAGSDIKFANESVQLASKYFGTPQRSLIFVSEQMMKKYINAKKTIGISSLNPRAQYNPYIGGRLVAHIMKNMVGDKASMKRIPTFIFNASQEVKLAFLQGLIAGDGYIKANKAQSKSEIGITTISSRLAGELIFLCRQIGIWARLENHGETGFRRGMNHQKSYRVVISGKKNLEILGLGQIVSNYDTTTKYEGIPYNLVGVSRINSKRFPRSVENQIFNCGVRRIPKSKQENYLKIKGLISEWNILEVKEIKEINPTGKYVYDLMVPGNNSFVAGNGAILVHNSGGESFRVNFALRLAISKLLTHRAGAQLQFLVIDEGFGSQDAPGIARLVEAIDTIKEDFEKILIISHLDQLKEEFPVRIEVSKNADGSTFEVVGV